MARQIQQMQLRWSTHQGTVLSKFDALLKSETLVDVTLAADGKQLKAHKIILSACSPYFEEIFKQTTGEKYPIVFLKNVKFEELELLVHFMYHGEVKVSQDDLPSLLNVAKGLRVRGLSSDQPVPPPPSNAKSIPLQDLINSNPTSSKSTPISKANTVPSSSSSNMPKTSFNFTNNQNSQANAIKIINCSSLAAPPPPSINIRTSNFPLIQTPTARPIYSKPIVKVTPANTGPVSSLVRIPVLQLGEGSTPTKERYMYATPVSTASSPSSNFMLPPRSQIRTVTTPNSEAFKTTRPTILGRKNKVTTFATPPVRMENDGPPILFPEVEILPDNKPSRYEFVSTKTDSHEVNPLEEEEVEMMTNENETSGNVLPPDLSTSGWTFVEPEKLANRTFSVPPIAPPTLLPRKLAVQRRLARQQRTRRLQIFQRLSRSLAGQNKEFMYQCKNCLKLYQRKGSLVRHEKYECNKPPQFQCDHCGIKMRHTFHKSIHEKNCIRRLPENRDGARSLISGRFRKGYPRGFGSAVAHPWKR